MSEFFGTIKATSGNYGRPEHMVQDDDHITLITNNVTAIKGKPVLIVDNNKAVYLRMCDIVGVGVKDADGNFVAEACAVKLNRQYFKVYTFRNDFEDFMMEKEETFDDLKEIAREQEESGCFYKTHRLMIGYDEIRKF